MQVLIKNAQIMAESGPIDRGWLLIENGAIIALAAGDGPVEHSATQVLDAGGLIIAPGFIDLHVHGGDGHEAMDADPTTLKALARFYARHGVTSFLPTTWTAKHADIMHALEAIASLTNTDTGGAQILGAHVEGPYLNAAKCGAQDPALIREASEHELLDILGTGIVKLIAIAPEYPKNRDLISMCREQGARVSAAHTDASYNDLRMAVDLGLTQATHTFNAMRGLHHREPGAVGAALMLDAITCEVIPDYNHLHPAIIALLYRIKGPHRTVIITDAVRGAGMHEGAEYTQDGRRVRIEGGAARLDDDTLAGSILTMDEAFRNFIAATGAPLAAAIHCASLTPARAIGVDALKGSLTVGKDADLILLDTTLNVQMTIVNGRVVYTKE